MTFDSATLQTTITPILISALVAAATAILTVVIKERLSFNANRERYRLELAWLYSEKRIEALIGLLKEMPRFTGYDPRSGNATPMFQSVVSFGIWLEQEAEPWLEPDQVEKLRELKFPLDAWTTDMLNRSANDYPEPRSEEVQIPSESINNLRAETRISIISTLQKYQNRTSDIIDSAKWPV